MTKCNSICIGKKCKRRKACACRCGVLASIHPALEDGCIKACNSDKRPESAEEYLCKNVGGEVLFAQYGTIQCGYDVTDSAQYQAYDEQERRDQQSKAASREIQNKVIIGLGILIAGAVIALLFGK